MSKSGREATLNELEYLNEVEVLTYLRMGARTFNLKVRPRLVKAERVLYPGSKPLWKKDEVLAFIERECKVVL